jgi:hypothetical protein
MATMKKAQSGVVVSKKDMKANPKDFKYLKKSEKAASEKALKSKAKPKEMMKNGGSLGMKSVKAGYDNNPGVTRADIITAATKKAKSGTTMKKAEGGIKVVPKNLNDRQINRVERIRQTNPERASKVASRISDRRNARGAETSVKPAMKSGGSMKKCKYGCK